MRDIATSLSGNLTHDVELRELPSGTDVARLRVATTTRRRSGEKWAEKTNYFTVEVYGSRARACAEHLGEGSRVVVDAELHWRGWTDKQSNRREAVTRRARQILFEAGRPRTDSSGESVAVGVPMLQRPPLRVKHRPSPTTSRSKRRVSQTSPPSRLAVAREHAAANSSFLFCVHGRSSTSGSESR